MNQFSQSNQSNQSNQLLVSVDVDGICLAANVVNGAVCDPTAERMRAAINRV